MSDTVLIDGNRYTQFTHLNGIDDLCVDENPLSSENAIVVAADHQPGSLGTPTNRSKPVVVDSLVIACSGNDISGIGALMENVDRFQMWIYS